VKDGAVRKALLNNWQLSMITTALSGRPLNAIVSGDSNNDANTQNDRTPGVGRNAYRGSEFISLDVRVTRDIPLFSERVKLRLLGEAFNITNRANFSGFVTTQYTYAGGFFRPTTNFLSPSSVSDPRILQLAAKIIF
jgi:hypothetical protein